MCRGLFTWTAVKGVAYPWSPSGYERAALVMDFGTVRVMTPPSTLARGGVSAVGAPDRDERLAEACRLS